MASTTHSARSQLTVRVGAIVVLPTLAVLSCHFIAFAWVIALLIPIHLAAWGRRAVFVPRIARRFFILGVFWLLWGLLSMFWAPDTSAAVHELSWLALGITVAAMFVTAADSEGVLEAIRVGWLFAYFVAAAFAVWELATGNHLVNDVAELENNQFLLISTFGNPNNYAAFLLLSSPFLFWTTLVTRGPKRWFAVFTMLSMPVLLILSEGRIALFGLFAEALVLLSFQRRRKLGMGIAVAAAVVSGTLGVLFLYEPMALKLLRLRSELSYGGSTIVRYNLLLNGLVFLRESLGFGIGAGGFESRMMRPDVPFDTATYRVFVVNPHNFWIEVLSQYGVLVFLALMVWFLSFAREALRLRRDAITRSDRKLQLISEILIIGLTGYLFATAENSSYMEVPINWLFLGSILGVISNLSVTTREQHRAMLVDPANDDVR